MRTELITRLPDGIDPSWRFGIVHSTFHADLVEAMVRDAETVLLEAGIPALNIMRYPAPGSFELPLIGNALAKSGAVDALLGFGVIVQGETHHAELLATETVRGMMTIQMVHGMPFAFEVLFVDSIAQAQERASGPNGKGKEAAYAALHSLVQLNRINGRAA